MTDWLLIRGASVLDVETFQLEKLDILVSDDRIEQLDDHISAPEGATILDATGKIAIPGLINAHTHAHNNLTKGQADNWTLEDLRSHGFGLYFGRTPEDQYLSAAIGAIEMVRTGCTAAYDQFVAVPTHSEEGIAAVVQAYKDVGLRAVLAPAVSDVVFYHMVPGLLDLLPAGLRKDVERLRASPAEGLVRCSRDAVEAWHRTDGRISMATAPVIPLECSEELMRGCRDVSREFGVGLHTHLAETKIQAIASHKRWGRSIVSQLSSEQVLGPRFVGGHGVWIDQADISLLADRGAMIAHNPASNLKLGSGIAPVREMLDAGLILGIGSDGSMASDNQNMFEAMRFGALSSKVRFAHQPDRWVGAREVLHMATLGGARLLGLATEIGAIEVGRKADIVLLGCDSPFLQPLNDVANALVYAETGADVSCVIIGGRIVLRDGKVLTVDESMIRTRAAEAAQRLWKENAGRRDLPKRIEPFLRSACAACAAMPYPIDRYAMPAGVPGGADLSGGRA